MRENVRDSREQRDIPSVVEEVDEAAATKASSSKTLNLMFGEVSLLLV